MFQRTLCLVLVLGESVGMLGDRSVSHAKVVQEADPAALAQLATQQGGREDHVMSFGFPAPVMPRYC